MITPILEILASVIGVFATWYLGKEALKYYQAYRNGEETSQVSDAKTQVQQDDQAANLDSDKLKSTEGR